MNKTFLKNVEMKNVEGVGWIAKKPTSDLFLKIISFSAIASIFAYAVVASIK